MLLLVRNCFSFWKVVFAWANRDYISTPFLPSWVISVLRYPKVSRCLNFVPFTYILHVTFAFRLVTITSVFLPFSSRPLFKLFLSITSKSACTSFSFSVIKTVSSAYRKLLMIFPPTLIPGCSSKFLMMTSLNRLKRSGESTQPCLSPLFIFWKELVSLSTLTVLITLKNYARCLHNSQSLFLIYPHFWR